MPRHRILIPSEPIAAMSGAILRNSDGKVDRSIRICYRRDSNKHYFASVGRRDLNLHPTTPAEAETRTRFAAASHYASDILKDETQRAAALKRFNAAKRAHKTTANTLRGFLMQEHMHKS